MTKRPHDIFAKKFNNILYEVVKIFAAHFDLPNYFAYI